ncbi:hypothetical protein EB151_14570, partial [archaeon]|nr:hypothetical protein [archaeon]
MSSQTASVLTWGCTHNQKDSQLIEQQLIVGGYQIGDRENYNKSDVVIINTCTVKTPTENKITFVLDDLQKTKKKVVVAGCLSQAEPEMIKEKYPNFIILGVNASDKILGVLGAEDPLSRLIPLESMSEKRGIKDNKLDWIEKPLLDSTQWNEKLNIIQINEGCLNYCTFCATKKARGHLRSYQKESIISAIRKTPTPEVWLTSQDTACWGFDIDDDLSNLLNEIDKINRKFIVRVGMGNPNNLIKIVDKETPFDEAIDKSWAITEIDASAGEYKVMLTEAIIGELSGHGDSGYENIEVLYTGITLTLGSGEIAFGDLLPTETPVTPVPYLET